MVIPRIIADFETQLSTAVAIGGTTFDLSSVTDDDGEALPAGSYCFTIDNGSSSKEYFFGTLSGSTVSSVQNVSRQGVLTSGALRAHRVGASVIITDFIALKVVASMIAGEDGLDGSSPLFYDTAPTLSDPKELATVAYVLSVVAGGTVNFSAQTVSGTAGESLTGATTPQFVYFKEADQRWWKVDTDDTSTYQGVRTGFAISTATAGNGVTIHLSGVCAGFTALTAGSKYYGSTTGGNIGTSVTGAIVGIGWSTTQILFTPSDVNIPIKGEKDAMAGGSTFGTPSSTNKFITQDYNASATGIPVVRTYLNAASPATWSKPSGLKYVVVEVQAAGGNGSSSTSTDMRAGGGGAGGYAKKLIPVASLGATETVTIGAVGAVSSFGSHCSANNGTSAGPNAAAGAAGGTATGGDVNITGQTGFGGSDTTAAWSRNGAGGDSVLGFGGPARASSGDGGAGAGYGGGGAGGFSTGTNDQAGGAGAPAIVIVSEYYS
jgi:hypothetical protein